MVDAVSKKIGLLIPSLKFGGAERVALNLAKALKDTGAQVDILLMSNEGEFLVDAQKHFSVIDLKCNKTYKLPGKLLAYFFEHKPDVLLSSFWKLNLCACLAKIIYPWVTLLLWEHSPPSKSKNSPKWLYALTASVFYRLASKVVAVSTGVYNDIDTWTVGLRDKLVIIFNPIMPPEPYSLANLDHSDKKQVLWLGRLDEPKNPGLLLEAFALLSETSNAKLVFVGDGSLKPALEKRCSQLELNNSVSFLGYHSNPYAVIAKSDLLVVSSDREGLPSVIVEAMYCGLRVVSTDCTAGINDILLGNQFGTIVPCRDISAMARAIETELKTQHRPQDQIDGAQRFLPKVVAQQFILAMR